MATAALQEAESNDGYLAAIASNSANRRARIQNDYRPATEIIERTPYGRIITMMPSADDGMPHTRGKDLICIPAYYPKDRLQQLLDHERVHLHQKQNRQLYMDFYKKYWEFKENYYVIPENIKELMRINPDTVGWPQFIWRDTWIPICIFQRIDKPSLRECSYCWYNPKGGVLLKTMPPAWREFFGTVGQSEHPNELSACYAADKELYSLVPAAKLYYKYLS